MASGTLLCVSFRCSLLTTKQLLEVQKVTPNTVPFEKAMRIVSAFTSAEAHYVSTSESAAELLSRVSSDPKAEPIYRAKLIVMHIWQVHGLLLLCHL